LTLAGCWKSHFFRLIKNAPACAEASAGRQMQVEFYEIPLAGAPEILRSEAYLEYAATTRDEGNAADGRFSAAC